MTKLFRTFALLLAGLFALSLIVGCGGDDDGGGEEAAVVQPRLCQHPKSRGRCLQVACLPAPEDTSGWRLRLESEAPSS